MSHNYTLAEFCVSFKSPREAYRGDGFWGSLFAIMCCLSSRSFQGDLSSRSRIYLLTLWCADISQTAGGRGSAEHRAVMGGAEPHLPSASILLPLTAAARQASAPQLPTDTTSTPIPRVPWDATGTQTTPDSTAACPSRAASSSLSTRERDTKTARRWELNVWYEVGKCLLRMLKRRIVVAKCFVPFYTPGLEVIQTL